VKQIIEAGTDGATVCFFDAAALPEDFDQRVKVEGLDLLSSLQESRRFWFHETGADGGYLFHFYVDEEVPEHIRKHSLDPVIIPRFQIPSGTLWACGAEYAGRFPLKEGLEKYDHMGGKFELRPGEYAVMVWRTDWPDEMIEQALENSIGRGAIRRFNWLGTITGIGFLSTLALTLIVVFKTLNSFTDMRWARTGGWWAGVVAAWSVIVLLMVTLKRLDKNPARKDVVQEFPSIVVRMMKIG
jgi:hypothetical protein